MSREAFPAADARDSVDLSHQHGGPRDPRLVDGDEGSRPAADRPGALRSGPDHEPRLVDEIADGEPEGVAEVDKASELVRSVPGEPAAVDLRVRGEDAYRAPAETCQRGDQRPAEAPAELEDRLAVEHELQDPPHVVGLAVIARDDRQRAPPRADPRDRWSATQGGASQTLPGR